MTGSGLSPRTVRRLGVSLTLAGLLALVVYLTDRGPVPPLAATGTMGGGAGPLELVPAVRAAYPHDPAAFTQGLLWHQGSLYESTGNYGQSSLRRVEPASGQVRQKVDLPSTLFGEGLERVGGRLFQLTWRENEALEWDLESFEPLARYAYEGEGWGLCFDGERLIRSDGSDRLHFHDPDSFAPLGGVSVRLLGRPQPWLNELECAEGWVYANVYGSRRIVRIDPGNGEVLAVVDASALVDRELAAAGVLNGIAYNPERRTFYLTGKNWPKLFEVVFVPAR